jgi:hypothetical protein
MMAEAGAGEFSGSGIGIMSSSASSSSPLISPPDTLSMPLQGQYKVRETSTMKKEVRLEGVKPVLASITHKLLCHMDSGGC